MISRMGQPCSAERTICWTPRVITWPTVTASAPMAMSQRRRPRSADSSGRSRAAGLTTEQREQHAADGRGLAAQRQAAKQDVDESGHALGASLPPVGPEPQQHEDRGPHRHEDEEPRRLAEGGQRR